MQLKGYFLAGSASLALMAAQGWTGAAAARTIPDAASYAELLDPVPLAAERLAADDTQKSLGTEVAQMTVAAAHHHHHHARPIVIVKPHHHPRPHHHHHT